MSRGPRKKTAPYPDLPGPAKNLSQAVSFSLTREKAPIYTMGSPDVRAFSRNKRGIAGSLIWVNFDRHALLNVVRRAAGRFIANIDDIRPQFRSAQTQFISETAIFDAQTERGTGIPVSATIDDSTMPRVQAISGATGFKESAVPWYSDQILPFDITLAGCNEIGAAASMKIFGVEILNEGNGVSIDDAVSEMQATFVFTRAPQSFSLGCIPTWSPSLHPPPVTFRFRRRRSSWELRQRRQGSALLPCQPPARRLAG